MITFVVHYEELTAIDKSKILECCDTFMHWNPKKLIELSFASARKFHPNCRTIILTNQSTKLELGPEVEIIRSPTDKFENRLSQVISTRNFLKEWKEFSHLVFHDFDMLFQRNIENIFTGYDDIHLVLRGGPLMNKAPINMGLVCVDQGSISQAVRFYDKILNQMLSFPEYHIWTGSQIAVHKLLFHTLLQHPDETSVIYDHIKLRFLPESYNFTPKDNFKDKYYEGKAVLHFKGMRKSQMPGYWEKYFVND